MAHAITIFIAIQFVTTNSSQSFLWDLLRPFCPCNYPLNCLSPSTLLRPDCFIRTTKQPIRRLFCPIRSPDPSRARISPTS